MATVAVSLGATRVQLDPRAWPVVAQLESCSGFGRARVRCLLVVRRHADGRALVCGQREDRRGVRHAGVLVAAREAVAPAIERIGRVLGADPALARGVVAQLGGVPAVGAA